MTRTNKMDNEFFEIPLIVQYEKEIEEVLQESEHVYRSTIDYDLLDQKVCQLIKCARIDGLDEKVIWDMLQAKIPSYVNYVNYKAAGKKVA